MEYTPCQAKALHELDTNKKIFLTGAAGTGKSFLLSAYLQNKNYKEYPVLASTGAAAVLVGGRTFHGFFGLGIMAGGPAATVIRALRSKPLHTRLLQAKCIVIDEVSMLSGQTLAVAEEVARAVRQSNEPWGGLRLIVVGDFAQLPPVQQGGGPKDWGFLHSVWEKSNFHPICLQTTVRTTEPTLLAVLNDVRKGNVTERVRDFLVERTNDQLQEFDGTKLFPRRDSAELYNNQRLSTLEGELHSFATEYSGQAAGIEQLKKQCPISESLQVKIGALVMFRKNDTGYPFSYVNGTLGTVVSVDAECIGVRLENGDTIDVYPTEFNQLDGSGSVKARAENFPLTLAWATTIHKAQGASIDRLMLSMQRLWESGHAYVALSRVRTEQGLCIESWSEESIFADSDVLSFYETIEQAWEVASSFLPQEAPESYQGLTSLAATVKPTKKKKSTPNHVQTKEALEDHDSIQSLAEALGWSPGTIIKHIEKLLQEKHDICVDHLRPPDQALNAVAEATFHHGTEKLKPLYEFLEGVYSYDTIRLCIVFLKKENAVEVL